MGPSRPNRGGAQRTAARPADGEVDGSLRRTLDAARGAGRPLDRKVGADLRDAVAHILRRLVQILVEVELDHEHRVAVVRLRHHAFYAGDRRDLLLDRIEDLLLDDFRRGTGIDDADGEPGRRHFRKLVGLQLEQREYAE